MHYCRTALTLKSDPARNNRTGKAKHSMNNLGAETYQVFAIRYATNLSRRRGQNFIFDSMPEKLQPMAFFNWVIVNENRTIAIDTGMSQAKANHHGYTLDHSPTDGLRALGIAPEKVDRVVLTHLHFDHIGNVDHFPAAHFWLPEAEMNFVVGPEMRHAWLRRAYETDEIVRVLGYLYDYRFTLHGSEFEIAPGVSVHHVGGHTAGQEIVRVKTARGWIVLASDALHYYEEYERGVPFTVVHSIADMLNAHDKIRALAESDEHVIPAHDPLVMDKYPAASPDLDGFVVRLDVAPRA